MIKTVGIDDIVEMHSQSVFAVCRGHTTNIEAAWDAYQETFLVLSRKFDSLDLGEDLGPWLRETARRCCRASVRKGQKDARILSLSEPGDVCNDDASVEDSYELKEVIRVVTSEIQNLSLRDRSLLYMAIQENKSHREIAAVIECPVGSVHARLDSAKESLRKRLSKRGIAMSLLMMLFVLREESVAFALSPGEPATKTRVPPVPPIMFGSVQKLAVVALAVVLSIFAVGSFMVAAEVFSNDRTPIQIELDESKIGPDGVYIGESGEC